MPRQQCHDTFQRLRVQISAPLQFLFLILLPLCADSRPGKTYQVKVLPLSLPVPCSVSERAPSTVASSISCARRRKEEREKLRLVTHPIILVGEGREGRRPRHWRGVCRGAGPLVQVGVVGLVHHFRAAHSHGRRRRLGTVRAGRGAPGLQDNVNVGLGLACAWQPWP